jgi:hypothetical protein
MEFRPGRYLAGLCVSALGLCGGGWLVLTPFAFGYPGRGREAVIALATGGGLVIVAALSLLCWALAWRRRLRADGVLAPRQSRPEQRKAQRKTERKTERKSERSARRQARAERLVRVSRQRELEQAPDPAQVLTDLRALLTPLLSAAEESVAIIPAEEQARAEEQALAAEPVREPVAVAVAPELAVPGPVVPGPGPAEASREVQVPGHLRGARSASFFAVPRQPEPDPQFDDAGSQLPGALLQGAELLMVGTGEEESW